MSVLTIGETMAVFTPKQNGKMRYASEFKRTFAGAESNVAIALANLGVKVSWVSQLGEDELGHAIHSFIAGHLVDTSHVAFTNEAPTSIMLKEYRNYEVTNVYYYRKNSAFALMDGSILEENMFVGVDVLHLTGITPLLSETAYQTCLTAIKFAKKHNVKIVFDPNIRMKLLNGEEHLDRLRTIANECDYFLPNIQEAKLLFNIESSEPLEVLAHLKTLSIPTIVLKDGSRGTYYYNEQEEGFEATFDVKEVESVGAGDAFAAGFIFGVLNNETVQQSVVTANALGAQAIMTEGDIENLPSLPELQRFMNKQKGIDNVNR